MELVSKILAGDVKAAARLMTDIEDGVPGAVEALGRIYPHTGRGHIAGLTGAPGVGKSTLVDALISTLRQRNISVGVIAIDPTSPFTGGALLGDRVRMQRHSTDRGVFIRSVATRRGTGGLAQAAISMVHVMDAMSKDIILVETAGVGQGDIDITKVADTSVLILTPGMGDAIQLMKAGILEAADIFVINKADQDGARSLEIELEAMLAMKERSASDWKPAVVLTEAISGQGTDDLVDEVQRHRQFLTASGGRDERRRERARIELTTAIESSIKNHIQAGMDKEYLERLIDDLVKRKTNPDAAAREIINRSIKGTRSVST